MIKNLLISVAAMLATFGASADSIKESKFSSSMSCEDSRKYSFSEDWVLSGASDKDKAVINLVNPEKGKSVSLQSLGNGICLITVSERQLIAMNTP